MESHSTNNTIAVLLPGRVDDGGWVQSAAQAVDSLRAAQWQISTVAQPQFVPEQALPAAEKLAQAGTGLIIGHGHEYIEAFLKLAPAYPQSSFFAMDKLAEEQSWPENLCCLFQRQDEAAYLCGRLSAHMTRTGNIGFVGGIEVPTQTANSRAFELGARSLDPTIEVMIEFAGSFENPREGHRMALSMIERGADIFLHTASETGNGVIEACNEQGIHVIGFTLDQQEMAPERMLTSLVVEVEKIYQAKIQEVVGNRFGSGIWTVGLAEEMVGLAPLSNAVPDEVAADINGVRQAIIDGRIIV